LYSCVGHAEHIFDGGMNLGSFSRTDFTVLINGKKPWQQNLPVKSSKSAALKNN